MRADKRVFHTTAGALSLHQVDGFNQTMLPRRLLILLTDVSKHNNYSGGNDDKLRYRKYYFGKVFKIRVKT